MSFCWCGDSYFDCLHCCTRPHPSSSTPDRSRFAKGNTIPGIVYHPDGTKDVSPRRIFYTESSPSQFAVLVLKDPARRRQDDTGYYLSGNSSPRRPQSITVTRFSQLEIWVTVRHGIIRVSRTPLAKPLIGSQSCTNRQSQSIMVTRFYKFHIAPSQDTESPS
jgi:hypothetical protein